MIDVVAGIIKNSDVGNNGNYILHVWFNRITPDLEEKIANIDGVVESGLFIGYNIIVIK